MSEVKIPAKAVAIDGEAAQDISKPTTSLLTDLNLLPSESDLKDAGKISAAFGGPPQSVAVIEANATAMAKGWAGGLSAGVVAAWASVRAFYDGQPHGNQRFMLLGAAIATAAAVLAIGYILGSDVRGRAAASVATIQGRVAVGTAVIRASERTFKLPEAVSAEQIIALPVPIAVRRVARPSEDESGWFALALKVKGPVTEYLLAKGTSHDWVSAEGVAIDN